MKVQLFIPCYIDQLYPQTGQNTLKILQKVGCEVIYNPNQTCCGQPAFNSGYWAESKALAEKFFNDYDPNIPIVSPSGSCTGFIKRHYAKLFPNEAEKLALCDTVSNNLFELSDFLCNHLKIVDLGAVFPHKVTLHRSCSSIREYGLTDEPERLLSHVKGLELIEMEESTTCCGFGGTFAIKQTDISTAMVAKKVEYALATGAEYIVGTEASCLMNITSYCQKQGLPIRGIHLADILNAK